MTTAAFRRRPFRLSRAHLGSATWEGNGETRVRFALAQRSREVHRAHGIEPFEAVAPWPALGEAFCKRRYLEFIRALLEDHPDATRRALSTKLCEAWNWVQPNGSLRDGVCRGLLLALHQGGHIELPTPQWRSNEMPWTRLVPAPFEVDTTPLDGCLQDLGPVQLADRCAAPMRT